VGQHAAACAVVHDVHVMMLGHELTIVALCRRVITRRR
jgi:hypothetical protein